MPTSGKTCEFVLKIVIKKRARMGPLVFGYYRNVKTPEMYMLSTTLPVYYITQKSAHIHQERHEI